MSDFQPTTSPIEEAFFDLKALKQRGWTARLVSDFLGEPDDTDWARVANTGRPKNLYCAKRVAFIEIYDANFRAEKEKAAMYSDRLKQTQSVKKKNLAGVVEDMTLPEFDLLYEELLDQANKKKILDENLAGTVPERVALEILLDRMASLAWRLEIFGGHAGIREARNLLRTRMLAHLVNRYPPLSETAQQYADECAGASNEENAKEILDSYRYFLKAY